MTNQHLRELIQGFVCVDSQVAQATIVNNKITMDDNWTGGASASVFKLSPPASGNVQENYEQFVQKVCGNEFYTKKIFQYGVTPTFPATGVTVNMFLEICDNIYSYPEALESTSGVNVAVSRFLYINSCPAPADFDARWVLTMARNKVHADGFIFLDFTQADYTDKWWFYIYDNFKFGRHNWVSRKVGGIGGQPGALVPYTSTMLIRDNQMGTNASNSKQYSLYTAPLNSVKLINGSDFSTGDTSAGTISPAPAVWRDGRFYKKGGVLGVEVVTGGAARHYISTDNGSNWYQA